MIEEWQMMTIMVLMIMLMILAQVAPYPLLTSVVYFS